MLMQTCKAGSCLPARSQPLKPLAANMSAADIVDISAHLRKSFREQNKRVFDKLKPLFRASAAFAGTMDGHLAIHAMIVCLAEPARESEFVFRDVITLTCNHTINIPFYDGARPYMADLFGENFFLHPFCAGDFTHLLRDDRPQISGAQAAAYVRNAVSHLLTKGWEGFVITAHAGCLNASAVINMGTGQSADQRTQAVKAEGGMYQRFMADMPRILQMQMQRLLPVNLGASLTLSWKTSSHKPCSRRRTSLCLLAEHQFAAPGSRPGLSQRRGHFPWPICCRHGHATRGEWQKAPTPCGHPKCIIRHACIVHAQPASLGRLPCCAIQEESMTTQDYVNNTCRWSRHGGTGCSSCSSG